jgi:hypothetical protein
MSTYFYMRTFFLNCVKAGYMHWAYVQGSYEGYYEGHAEGVQYMRNLHKDGLLTPPR